MIREVLQSISGIATYPVIALILFFAFFTGVLIWIARLDKGFVARMARLPLESETTENK